MCFLVFVSPSGLGQQGSSRAGSFRGSPAGPTLPLNSPSVMCRNITGFTCQKGNFMRILRLILFSFLALAVTKSGSFATETPVIPDSLSPWVDWVLHDYEEERLCIPHYDDPKKLQCNWPTELTLSLNDMGGSFEQKWRVFHKSYLLLPGNDHHWPGDVTVDGQALTVINKNDRPQIMLTPGEHTVTGVFEWRELPEYLQLPPESGLVSLSVNNDSIPFPSIDDAGRLWLKKGFVEEKIENRLKIEAFRMIDDRIPPRIVCYFTLDVAGSAREITLGPLISPKAFVPLSLVSTLPAKLEQDGTLRAQVRPGRHTFTLTLRHVGPLSSLTFQLPDDGFWPDQEIWLFQARSNLRIVEIEGVTAIDPLQTSVPQDWLRFPAYRMLTGDTMRFKEIKRGDPQPAPDQLAIQRDLWLRFDGSGFTVRDSISGKKNTSWRLESSPALNLGRVSIDGKTQFITRKEGSEKAGIELREGLVNLVAESTYVGDILTLPMGWDHDFVQAGGQLHLPPGWRLLHASGIDNTPRTWLKRWDLLDFFMVLVFTIAVLKLYSAPMAAIAFATLVLTFHEGGAPHFVWFVLLVGFALLKYLPDSRFKKAIRMIQAIAVLLLIVIVIPYSIQALRIGIYPQLAKHWQSITDSPFQQREDAKSPTPVPGQVLMEQSQAKRAAGITSDEADGSSAPSKSKVQGRRRTYGTQQVMQYDPKQINQTGPGLPQWKWDSLPYSWSGPVAGNQEISLFLIGPKSNLVLSFLRVLLIIVLALGLFHVRYHRGKGFQLPDLKTIFLVLVFALFLLPVQPSEASDFPPAEMLNDLRARLLEQDECFPSCADISKAAIRILPEELRLRLEVASELRTAVPIPGTAKHWLPQAVSVDGKKAEGLFRSDENVWVLLSPGNHLVECTGRIRKQNTLQLPFPLHPHRVTVDAKGWIVEGVRDDGTIDSQIQFKRIVEEESRQAEILETGVLPPFVRVERTLLLGLVWKVETRIQRISPSGSAIVLNIPLLPGESITTEGIRAKDGFAQVSLSAQQAQLGWESFLEPVESLELKHAETNDWTEIWKVDVSQLYHLEPSGIPVILHKTGNRWYPTWHPWPGEKVTLSVTRPPGTEGQTLTVEKSHLELKPGQRSSNVTMVLSMNSSQGGQHVIELPPQSELQEVKIGGTIQPIRQEGRKVPVPIRPGSQRVELTWREARGIAALYKTSKVDLGTPSVNASVDLHLPHSRWPLLVGGEQRVGPAVLFWSMVLILVLAAFGLAKTGLTPLRFHHWFLLGIGMSMSTMPACILVVGWLIGLEYRRKADPLDKGTFNLVQIGLAILTVLALGALVTAISRGLLGHPDMNIVGNGSSRNLLRWYQDISDKTLPQAWVFSVPMYCYRLAMLAWALWISFGLVRILRWGWGRYTTPTIWYHLPKKQRRWGRSQPEMNGKESQEEKNAE